MATRESAASRGERRSRFLRTRIGTEIGNARRAAGLSIREVARLVGVSPDTLRRLERGEARTMSLDLVARVAEVVGLELAASLHPNADPARDKAHLALLARMRSRLERLARWRAEVPVPIAGDLRSGDAIVGLTDGGDVLIEAETHLGDIQLIERKSAAKMRDLGALRLVLLVSDTRHNREVIARHPELGERFPIGTRACVAALRRGLDPGGDCLVIL